MKTKHAAFVCLSLAALCLLLIRPAASQTQSKMVSGASLTPAKLPSQDARIPRTVRSAAKTASAHSDHSLYFEANRGQTDSRVDFFSRGAGYALYLRASDAVIALTAPSESLNRRLDTAPSLFKFDRDDQRLAPAASRTGGSAPLHTDILRMKLLDANEKSVAEGQEASPATTNYFMGNDPAKWHTGVPAYASVKYRDIYPGTDLIYYGNSRQMESDFVLSPGADVSHIKLRIDGAKRLAIDSQGSLAMSLGGGRLLWRHPVIYQETDGRKQEIRGGYRLNARNEVSFWLGAYDATRPLVIDPVLVYSTYLGGSGDDNFFALLLAGSLAGGVATDSTGNVYVTGVTISSDFPTLSAAYPSCASCASMSPAIFVTKYNPTGTLVYSTYLGGSSFNAVGAASGSGGIAVDDAGNAYITGSTNSPDFPVTAGAYKTQCGMDGTCNGGITNAFVTVLNPSGAGLVYSTFLGGSCGEDGGDIAVDSAHIAYVTGDSCSPEFPVTGGALQSPCIGGPGACTHVFVTSFNPSGSALVYSALFGGSASEYGGRIRLDTSGAAYVVGGTNSVDFPTVPAGGLPGSGPTGGAFVTANGGLSWTASNSGLPNHQVTALVVDPVTPTTVYAGTPMDGVFKSVNGGGSWSPINSGLPGVPFGVTALAISGGTVYAAIGGGIFWSTDGGSTWNPSVMLDGGGPAIAIAIDSTTTPQTVYVGKRKGQVQKSTDGGQNFSSVSTTAAPYAPPNCNNAIRSLVIDPQTPSVLYWGSAGCGIFKSSDGAQNWAAINNGFGTLFTQLGLEAGGQLGVLPLAIDTTTNPSTVYAGVLWSIWKSSDGGASWSMTANFGPGGPSRVTTITVDISPFPSNPPNIYAGLAVEGARKSSDRGVTWNNISTGIDMDIQAMAVSRSIPATLYAGTVLRNKGFVAKLSPSGADLSYSTYLGGNGNDFMNALFVNSTGEAYVAGGTTSTNFPTTSGVLQAVNQGGANAFVAKLNRTGTALAYSTYVGGSIFDLGVGLAVDSSGVAAVDGFTYSSNFPTVNPPLFASPSPSNCGTAPWTRPCGHGFLFQLNATGTALVSSTYLGGTQDDYPNDLAMDATPSVSITGMTSSTDFPTLNAAQSAYAGGNGDAFVTKIDFSNSTQTLSGPNVSVQPSDSATGTMPASVKFDNVILSGNTTVGTSSTAPTTAIPANFQLGNPATFYNLSTSATFTGSAQVCISYAGVNYTDPTQLRLFHYTGGSWMDVTTSLNPTTETICGTVMSFSPFAILQRTDLPPTANAGTSRTVGCAGPGGASVTLNGSASSDPNGVPLTYTWTGPFGTATGVSPSVLLPLGTSTISLVVNDIYLSSTPASVSITVAVGVQGLKSPLSSLVPSGQPAPVPSLAFQSGRTLPLSVDLACGATQLVGGEVAPPRIVALVRNGAPLNLQTIDPSTGLLEDSNWIFRAAGKDWVYNLRTADLTSGTYTMTIQMPDGAKYDGAFVLR